MQFPLLSHTMAHYPLAPLHRRQRYKLIAGAIVPRPIAWVTTLNADGSCNAAPFSAFNYVSEDPPLIVLGLQVHDDDGPRSGEVKDTTRNIRRTGEFVVNLLDEDLLADMVRSATTFPTGISEVTTLGLALAPSTQIAVPRIERCPFALECRTYRTLEFSDHRAVVIGEVLSVYARDDVVDPSTLRVNLERYRPVGRLFGALYCTTDRIVSCPTPDYDTSVRSRAQPAVHASDSGPLPGTDSGTEPDH
jgi:flavin reductase (DIM6/NTAB) family NADH-FMN oxidoreductase RutF